MTIKLLRVLVNELEALNIDWYYSLRSRQRDVVCLTLGIKGYEPLAVREISEIMNLSTERIRQQRSKAEKQLIFIRYRHLQQNRELRDLFYLRLRSGEALLQWLQSETHKAYEEFQAIDVIVDTPIQVLNLSNRTYSCLYRCQIRSVREILDSRNDLMKIRNLGLKSLIEIQEAVNTLIFEKTGARNFWLID